MPLPGNGQPWPPPNMADPYRAMKTDDAWYSGDPARLDRIYNGPTLTRRERVKLWGRRRTYDEVAGRRDPRLHVPLPGDVASASASLLFGDMPTISHPDEAAQQRLDELLDKGKLHDTLLGAADVCSPLGSAYLRLTWDRDIVPDRPIIDSVQPDRAVPEFRFGMLRAVTFWEVLDTGNDKRVLRHLERHEPGFILHGLYEGSDDQLGRQVPLTAHPDTEHIAQALDPAGDGQSIATGTKLLTASFAPNMLPNRLHRGSPLGRSDYAGLHGQFMALDETWTSWMRDLRLGRARLIVPKGFLRDEGPGQGASFDADREVWSTLNMPPTEQGASPITESQFKIRVEEHQRTAEAITRQVAMTAGYSAQAFGLDGDGQAVTATEVNSRDARSLATRGKKVGYWKDPLRHIVHAWMQLDSGMFGHGYNAAEPPAVEWPDAVQPDPKHVAETVQLLRAAEVLSDDTAVRMVHPDWDDTAVREEVGRLGAQRAAEAPPAGDPVGNFPLDGPPQPQE